MFCISIGDQIVYAATDPQKTARYAVALARVANARVFESKSDVAARSTVRSGDLAYVEKPEAEKSEPAPRRRLGGIAASWRGDVA